MPGFILLWCWVRIFGRLPRRVLYAIADLGAAVAWYVSPRLRAVTRAHMRRACAPEATPRERTRAARGCLRSAYRYWADLAWGAHRPAEQSLDRLEGVDGFEHFFAAHDRGCGVILVSAHLGSPEHMIRTVGALGLDVLVLTEPLSPPALHRLVHEVRAAPGVRFVPADMRGVRSALQHLRSGGMLAILGDRDVLGTGQPLPFFGEPARLPRGSVELALRADAEIVVGFVRHTERGGVRLSLDPPLRLRQSGDREADAAAGMDRVLRALERGIRESPDQWFALHPVWDEARDATPSS
ncbi:MAG: hypothetical protein F4Z25_06320 [Chloroflexi bacterium]|nr:hypothetical protein [Chloroflexota bacterium]